MYKAHHWALYRMWFQNKSELSDKFTSVIFVYNILWNYLVFCGIFSRNTQRYVYRDEYYNCK